MDDLINFSNSELSAANHKPGAKTGQGLAGLVKREKNCADRLVLLQGQLSKKEGEVVKARADKKKSEDELKRTLDENKAYFEKADAFGQEITKLESLVAHDVERLLSQIKRPTSLIPGLMPLFEEFYDALDKAKLPETSSRQFFTDLAEEELCVCGRIIGEIEKYHILDQCGRYLEEDLAGAVNSLKSNISTVKSMEEDDYRPSLSTLRTNFQELNNARTDFEAHRASEIEKKGERALELQSEIIRFSALIEDLEADLTEFTRPRVDTDDDSTMSIPAINGIINELRVKIAEVNGTLDLKSRIDLLNKILMRAKGMARDAIRTDMVKMCNEKIKTVLKNDPISIEKINRAIVLRGQAEASMGQTLAVGYTFISLLLSRGAHKFPFLVDSPAGPLDEVVRTTVGKMVPELCSQFIALLITTERDFFVNAIESVVSSKDIKWFTFYRKTPGTMVEAGRAPAESTIMENSVLVPGRQYFNAFNLLEN